MAMQDTATTWQVVQNTLGSPTTGEKSNSFEVHPPDDWEEKFPDYEKRQEALAEASQLALKNMRDVGPLVASYAQDEGTHIPKEVAEIIAGYAVDYEKTLWGIKNSLLLLAESHFYFADEDTSQIYRWSRVRNLKVAAEKEKNSWFSRWLNRKTAQQAYAQYDLIIQKQNKLSRDLAKPPGYLAGMPNDHPILQQQRKEISENFIREVGWEYYPIFIDLSVEEKAAFLRRCQVGSQECFPARDLKQVTAEHIAFIAKQCDKKSSFIYFYGKGRRWARMVGDFLCAVFSFGIVDLFGARPWFENYSFTWPDPLINQIVLVWFMIGVSGWILFRIFGVKMRHSESLREFKELQDDIILYTKLRFGPINAITSAPAPDSPTMLDSPSGAISQISLEEKAATPNTSNPGLWQEYDPLSPVERRVRENNGYGSFQESGSFFTASNTPNRDRGRKQQDSSIIANNSVVELSF
jgi:hypothetical protein